MQNCFIIRYWFGDKEIWQIRWCRLLLLFCCHAEFSLLKLYQNLQLIAHIRRKFTGKLPVKTDLNLLHQLAEVIFCIWFAGIYLFRRLPLLSRQFYHLTCVLECGFLLSMFRSTCSCSWGCDSNWFVWWYGNNVWRILVDCLYTYSLCSFSRALCQGRL